MYSVAEREDVGEVDVPIETPGNVAVGVAVSGSLSERVLPDQPIDVRPVDFGILRGGRHVPIVTHE